MANKPKNLKPSDFAVFCFAVYQASATMMDFQEYMEIYDELLKMLWWNHEIDTHLALSQNPNPSGVANGGYHG